MKKIIMMAYLLSAIFSITAYAAAKPSHDVMLDFTLNYKSEKSAAEHVMKNTVQLKENKWVIAGKLQTSKNDHVLLFLTRLTSHRNNKFNVQFMLVDSKEKNTLIAEPRIVAISGLPVQFTEQNDNQSLQLNALVKLAPHKA